MSNAYPPGRERAGNRLLLAGILALAAAVQFAGLGSRSIWFDELVSVRIAGQPSIPAMLVEYREIGERQPILSHLLLHGWMGLGFRSDAAVRVPSALMSVASVALLFVLGRRLGGRRLALVAAYLLAVSPFLLLFGRMARYYSLTLLLALASTLLLLEALDRTADGRRAGRWWILLGLAAAAGLLTNYLFAAVLAGHAAYLAVWLRGRPALRPAAVPWAASQAAAVMALAAWVLFDLEGVRAASRISARAFEIPGWPSLALEAVYPFFAFTLGETIFPWHPLAVAGMAAAGAAGALGLSGLRGPHRHLPLVALGATLAVSVGILRALVRDHPFETTPSRAIGALPFLLLILAAGIARMPLRLRVAALALVTASAGAAAWNYARGREFHNPISAVPTREAAASVAAMVGPGDLVVADDDLVFERYYRPGPGDAPLLYAQRPDAVRAAVEGGGYRRVWLVTLGRDGTRDREPVELRAWLQERGKLVDSRGYVPQNPRYRRIKERIQGFPGYRHKLTVQLYELQQRREDDVSSTP